LFLFIIEVSTARAGPVVILVNFPSLRLCVTASVLKAHPMASPVADLADVHVIKGGHLCFGLEPEIIKADFTACTLNGRANSLSDDQLCFACLLMFVLRSREDQHKQKPVDACP